MKLLIPCIAAILLWSCARTQNASHDRDDQAADDSHATQSSASPCKPMAVAPSVNMYIENSASMNGYFNEFGNAKDLRLVLFQIANKLNCKTLAFVNSTVIPANADALGVLKNMKLSDFVSYGKKGSVAESDLSNVLGAIVSKTPQSGVVSLLVSDFIFCPSKANALTSLGPDAEKTSITKIFKNKSLAVAIFRLSAQFDGIFYTGHFEQSGKRIAETNYKIAQKRPCYIWAIGGEREICWLLKDAQLNDVGIDAVLCLTSGDKQLSYHILRRKGTYEIDKKDNKHAVSARMGRNNEFVVDLEAELGNLPLPDDYLLCTDNYATNNPNYAVERIEIKGDKYRISIRGEKVVAGDLSIMLKIRVPRWVDDCDMNPEWDIRKKNYAQRTFGFKALVSGVCDAMTSVSDNYSFFNIKIN